MRYFVLAAFAFMFSVGLSSAADKPAKEVTLKGEINCSKCALNEKYLNDEYS